MSLFTTRVELHKTGNVEPTSKDYDTLHEEMGKEGFWRTIQLEGEDVIYHLPTAEYNYGNDSVTDAEVVLNLAKNAANQTKKQYSLLVTKVPDGRRYWHNLKEVK